ncbi:uracil-DNA glycosylase [Novosphingobium sp. Rr 2-17]|uniref:UdgX family uracil-DNA binding protein n=1 Tax=Novosphingobium sp. Rr 2-17 TaxID=555793 RepID=UPI000269919F|nr:UdgX family uracil-DNA binding protein [Novosphingobium sp. Rr 2-17]EIZ80367.1 uracil-DNA glycosylase [Novosphingobium sp. Rr 2-17]
MIAANLAEPDDFEVWREEARRLVQQGVPPQEVAWSGVDDTGAGSDLFAAAAPAVVPSLASGGVRASRAFMDLAKSAILHSDPQRLPLLYRLLWRLQDNPRLLDDAADTDVLAVERLAKQVRRDIHKMHAFVRFRSVREDDGQERYVAWFEPDHRIERATADFFVGRFANQRWSILTPRLSLHWDGTALLEGPAGSRADTPGEDATEELWLGYYRSIFNPARLKVGAMLKEMPRKYWKNLPEARQIHDLIAGAQKREASMIATGASLFADAAPRSLAEIANGISECRRCAIGCNGTRAVMGEGPGDATLMIVGEQPGDNEEREGHPFIGPAGQVLDQAMHEAGIDRGTAYVTNAVKHFKFAPRGKLRLHQNPTAGEIDTCRWWLDAERTLVKPKVILALGASGARGLLGRTPAIGRERGQALTGPDGTQVWLTAHPSYLLRLEGAAKEREHQKFAADLAGLARMLDEG